MSLEKADATLASDLRFAVPFAQYTDRVLDPAPSLLEEWDFFRQLALAMGTDWELGGRVGLPIPITINAQAMEGEPTAENIWERLCSTGALPFSALRAHPHGILAEVPTQVIAPAEQTVRDGDRLELADVDMLDELRQVARPEEHDLPDPLRPFLLTSRRMNEYYNSWGQDIAAVRARHGANPAFVHPLDLDRLGLASGEIARIESDHGAIDVVLCAADDVAPATVSIAHCWGGVDPAIDARLAGSAVNVLVSNDQDVSDEVGMARQSAIPVRIMSRPQSPDRK